MKISEIKLVYFSATYTTRKVVRKIAEVSGCRYSEYDITSEDSDTYRAEPPHFNTAETHTFPGGTENTRTGQDGTDLLVVGMPVYAGRIPASAARYLGRLEGNGAPAIIVCVYGNRDYDDALVELQDIVTGRGFHVVSAGAFIAMHSIFPHIGSGRPDASDMEAISRFAGRSMDIISGCTGTGDIPQMTIKGNRPYKIPGRIPVFPSGDRKCDRCGACAKLCPVHAIDPENPKKTDKEKCISCGRCIVVCHRHSRRFRGLLYMMACRKFKKLYSARREPETFFCR